MRLSYYCKSCRKKNYLKTKANVRLELCDELGNDEINRRCDHCGFIEKRHINRLTAEVGKHVIPLTIAMIVALTMGVFALGFVATITFAAPIWFYYNSQKTTHLFNKTKISRR